ncbi:hypothetical protein ACFFUB_12315 [Algimonas porphyrae]|uniref:Uncharacterized protein n=1 Tax=Algimonas porphyrae TaxID=1128113 RepID=A0ABQ5UX94_9PROT|nr:hypothetical protein [Algimonas porphyrae]GLQ19193.1 hypothetical protein GCM10007854_01480 [Algimonas porphyrae]
MGLAKWVFGLVLIPGLAFAQSAPVIDFSTDVQDLSPPESQPATPLGSSNAPDHADDKKLDRSAERERVATLCCKTWGLDCPEPPGSFHLISRSLSPESIAGSQCSPLGSGAVVARCWDRTVAAIKAQRAQEAAASKRRAEIRRQRAREKEASRDSYCRSIKPAYDRGEVPRDFVENLYVDPASLDRADDRLDAQLAAIRAQAERETHEETRQKRFDAANKAEASRLDIEALKRRARTSLEEKCNAGNHCACAELNPDSKILC